MSTYLHLTWQNRADRIQRQAAEETKAMFPQLKSKIQDGIAKLQQQVASVLSLPPSFEYAVNLW
jgi:hypothetical protein